jgi:hypothetical protein
MNRTIRTRLLKKFTATQNENWVDILDQLLVNYNQSIHSSHGMAPAQVNDSTEQMLRAQIALYPPTTHVKKAPLVVGQLVRLSRIQEKFEKDSYNFTLSLWRVSRVIIRSPRDVYEVSDLDGDPVKGRFYRDELLPVFEPLTSDAAPRSNSQANE